MKKNYRVYAALTAATLTASAITPGAFASTQMTAISEDGKTFLVAGIPSNVPIEKIVFSINEKIVQATYNETSDTYALTAQTAFTGTVTIEAEVTTQFGTEAYTTKATIVTPTEPSTALTETQVTVHNNVDTKDQVVVTNLTSADTVKVYSNSQMGEAHLIGMARATEKGVATVTIANTFGTLASIFVTKTTVGKLESAAQEFEVPAELQSEPLQEKRILVQNHVKQKDAVVVVGVVERDVVTVYGEDGKTVLGKVRVGKAGAVEIPITKGFSAKESFVYVTVKNYDKTESVAVKKAIGAESVTPKVTEATVYNEVGKKDYVIVKGVEPKDTIAIYSHESLSKGALIGTAKVGSKAEGEVKVSIAKGFADISRIYITNTRDNMLISEPTLLTVPAENATASLAVSDIQVVNGIGQKDSITVHNLSKKDVIKVYRANDRDPSYVIGSATARADGSLSIAIRRGFTDHANIYVTKTSPGQAESETVQINAGATQQSTPIAVDSAVASKVDDEKDTVAVKNLQAKDVIKVYKAAAATEANLIGKGTAKADGTVEIAIRKGFEAKATSVFVTKTTDNLIESNVQQLAIVTNPVTTAVSSANAVNGVGKKDSVIVNGIEAGDVINVYKGSVTKNNRIGKATAKENGSLSIAITKGFDTKEVLVTRTSIGQKESAPFTVAIGGEAQSAFAANQIITTENGTKKDYVIVQHVEANDVITVYSAADAKKYSQLATAKAKQAGELRLTIRQGFGSADKVYVTKTSPNQKESAPQMVTISAEAETPAPTADRITFTNNLDVGDVVKVSGLQAKDVVKVYDGKKVVGQATAKADGTLSVTLNKRAQFDTGETATITVTSLEQQESKGTNIVVAAPEKSQTSSINADLVVLNDKEKASATLTIATAIVNATYSVYANGEVVGEAIAKKAGIFDIQLNKTYEALQGQKLELAVREHNKTISDKVVVQEAK